MGLDVFTIYHKKYTLIGLLAHLLRRWARGGCQERLTTEPEDMVGALGIVN